MGSKCRILFTLNALYSVGEIVTFVSKCPTSPRGNLILYSELLYTCKEIMSESVSFVYLIDQIVTKFIDRLDFEIFERMLER